MIALAGEALGGEDVGGAAVSGRRVMIEVGKIDGTSVH